ncbi:MAG TPA: 50S ribosomal protein L27 [Candidatus Humimicrobiaceae bacterium]|nr:50S ribosomal protein L27 [Candidatus Humimicrobiaceae bacterium]
MSKKKAGGKLIQHERPNPKALGLKVANGETVKIGSILIKQKGTTFKAGEGVNVARDYSLFAVKEGIVKFGKRLGRKIVSIN